MDQYMKRLLNLLFSKTTCFLINSAHSDIFLDITLRSVQSKWEKKWHGRTREKNQRQTCTLSNTGWLSELRPAGHELIGRSAVITLLLQSWFSSTPCTQCIVNQQSSLNQLSQWKFMKTPFPIMSKWIPKSSYFW